MCERVTAPQRSYSSRLRCHDGGGEGGEGGEAGKFIYERLICACGLEA
jgi:hypothetical protein